jgi:transposase
MYYAAIDVASKGSYLYVRDRRGRKVEGGEMPTERAILWSVFSKYKGKKIEVAVEAGGHTRWIYDELKGMGVKVYVVNPNKVKAIASSKKKTDKIDAKILSELLRIGALPEEVIMAEGKDRELRDLIQARHKVISGYTNLLNYLRGLLRQEGIMFRAREFRARDSFRSIAKNKLPKHIRDIMTRYRALIDAMVTEKEKIEEGIARYVSKDIDLIKSIPGMGEISSRTIKAAIGEIKRFKKAKQLTSYCGLVPSVRSSGDRTEYGHITREGRSEVRRVGIQSAHAVLRSKSKESLPLRKWHEQIAKRRGKKTAVVALARKLITVLFHVLRDKKEYDYTLLKVA